MDLIAADETDNTISILLGNGDGTFLAKTDYDVGDLRYTDTSIREGDFNNDGNLDLAFNEIADGTIGILYGNGDGTYGNRNTLSVPSTPTEIEVVDLNWDGLVDIVAESSFNASTDRLRIFLSNGDGTFSLASYEGDYAIRSPNVADFTNDGVSDLILGDNLGTTFHFYTGNKDGTFASPTDITTGTASNAGRSVAIDYNNDGVLDLAVANSGDNTLTVHSAVTDESAEAQYHYVLSEAAARQSLTSIEEQHTRVLHERAAVGASLSRLQHRLNYLNEMKVHTEEAHHRVVDADTAFEAARLIHLQILQQASTAILTQANASPEIVLGLLQ